MESSLKLTLNPFEKLRNELISRRYSNKTVKSYIHYNKDFLSFIKNTPIEVENEDIKTYLVYLSEEKEYSTSSLNLTISTLKFYYGKILNKDFISVIKDDEEKCTIFAPCSMFEQYKSMLKNQLIEYLDSEYFQTLLSRLITYHAIREGDSLEYSKLVDWNELYIGHEAFTLENLGKYRIMYYAIDLLRNEEEVNSCILYLE